MGRRTRVNFKLPKGEAIRAGSVKVTARKRSIVTVEADENVPLTHLDTDGKPKRRGK